MGELYADMSPKRENRCQTPVFVKGKVCRVCDVLSPAVAQLFMATVSVTATKARATHAMTTNPPYRERRTTPSSFPFP